MTYLEPFNGATLAERLEHRPGQLIRHIQVDWNDLTLEARREYVDEYRLLRDALAEITDTPDPVIPCPWTWDEVGESLAATGTGYYSSVGALSVEGSRLVTAVRVTERTLRKINRMPATLNAPSRSHIEHLPEFRSKGTAPR